MATIDMRRRQEICYVRSVLVLQGKLQSGSVANNYLQIGLERASLVPNHRMHGQCSRPWSSTLDARLTALLAPGAHFAGACGGKCLDPP